VLALSEKKLSIYIMLWQSNIQYTLTSAVTGRLWQRRVTHTAVVLNPIMQLPSCVVLILYMPWELIQLAVEVKLAVIEDTAVKTLSMTLRPRFVVMGI